MPRPHRPTSDVSVAVLTFEVKGDGSFRVLPAGTFMSRDGRPAVVEGRKTGIAHWHLDATTAAALINQVNQTAIELVIDYEHQTLLTAKNGQPAPAAGWWKSLEWREGDGLYVIDPRWTARAKNFLDAEEYKYISPVFDYDKTGKPTRLRHIALTNDPGLDFQPGLQAALSAKFSAATTNQENEMPELLKKLLAALKLNEDATEEQALAALTQIQTDAAKTGELETQVAALKSATPDPAQYAPVGTVAELQAQVAALTNDKVEREVGEVVNGAMLEGKLLPAQEGWARNLGKSNLAALKEYIKDAAVVVPGGTQTGGKTPAGETNVATDSDTAVCSMLGIDVEEFNKTKASA